MSTPTAGPDAVPNIEDGGCDVCDDPKCYRNCVDLGDAICSVCHTPRQFFAGDSDICVTCAVFGAPPILEKNDRG